MRYTILLLGALVVSFDIWAQDNGGDYSQIDPQITSQGSSSLSLQEAIAIATEYNPAIEAARYNLIASQYKRRAAAGMRLPQVSLTGSYIHMGKDIKVEANHLKPALENSANEIISTGIQSGIITQPTATLLQGALSAIGDADWSLTLQRKILGFIAGEVTLPIFLGGRINIANRTARLDEDIAEHQTSETLNTLITEIIERYFGLVLSNHVISVRELVYNAMQRHLQDAMALESNGIIARSERLFMEYKLAEAERELQDARLQQQTLKEALAFSLNDDYSTDYTPSSEMFMVDILPDVEYFKAQAINHNPLLLEVDTQQKLAEENLRLKRADYFPQIVAMAGGSFYNYRVTQIAPRWVVGVGVELKLFDGLSREHNYAAARTKIDYVEQLSERAHNEIFTLIEKLYNDLQNARNRILSLASSITFAEEYLRDKEIAFAEGLATASGLIDAELNLANARIERIEAAYNFDISLARLLEASGLSTQFIDYMHHESTQNIKFDNI